MCRLIWHERTVGQVDMHVDWLSFTMREVIAPRTAAELYSNARQKLREMGNGGEKIFFNGSGFDATGARSPYRVAIAREDHGARIFGASHTETMLCELSGRGCEGLRNDEVRTPILSCVHDRTTRLDIAIDILTAISPATFANSRSHDRFRSLSFIRSATGETVYVGSPKSDRFCRVYRYNSPHPRANLLRVEFVFRRGLARHAALLIAECEDQKDFIARLGNTYGFNHKVWQPEIRTDERLSAPIVVRQDADTVYWLYKQVAPALRRMMESGAIDMTDWLEFVYTGKGDLYS